MKKLFWISVVIAILAAFFASANPDGLDFISKKLGFSDKGQERTAPMIDYSVSFLPEGGISTSTAGIAGILITLGIFWLAAYILKKGENKMSKKIIYFLVLMLIVASPAFAARPLACDDCGTVDVGKFEIELSYNNEQPRGGPITIPSLGLQIKRGILPNFDFGIEFPYSLTSPSGAKDTILHSKLNIFSRNDDEGLTGRIDIKLANADAASGLGTGYPDYSLFALYSKKIAAFNTHYNIGYTLVGVAAGSASADYYSYSIAAEYPSFGEKGDMVFELVGNSSQNPHPLNLQVGGRFGIMEGLKLDAGLNFGLNENAYQNLITAGMTVGF